MHVYKIGALVLKKLHIVEISQAEKRVLGPKVYNPFRVHVP
jgi:hypothetical protein